MFKPFWVSWEWQSVGMYNYSQDKLPSSMNSRKSDDRRYNLHCKSPFRFETAPDITIKRVLPTFTPSGDHSLRDGRWLSAPGNYTLRKSYLCIGPQYLQCMSGMTHIVSNWDPAAYITSAIDHSFSQQTSRTATIYLLHLYCSHGWAHKMGTLLLICSLFQSVLDW